MQATFNPITIEATTPSGRIKHTFDHTRIRYKYLTQGVVTARLYTKRPKRFHNKYRCYDAVVAFAYRSNEPEVNFVTFCTTGKTGDYLCTEPAFPQYVGKDRRRHRDHEKLYRNMLLLHYEIDTLKEQIAEHRQKMIEKQLPSALSTYEEALFQD